MTSRVTRSSARLAAASSAAAAAATPSADPPDSDPPRPHPRKRKASGPADPVADHTPVSTKTSPPRRSKRPRVAAAEQSQSVAPLSSSRSSTKKPLAMAKPGSAMIPNLSNFAVNVGRSSSNPNFEADNGPTPGQENSKRKSSRNKKPIHGKQPSKMLFQMLTFDNRYRTFFFNTSCVLSPPFKEAPQKA